MCACGDVKETVDAPVVDMGSGSGSDAPMIDAPASLGPWGAPTRLASISSADIDWGPTARGDQLELYFASNRPGSQFTDIYVSTRASTTSSWGAPVLVAPLNSSGSEDQPCLSPDGLTIYFGGYRDANFYDVYTSTRSSVGGTWGTAVMVPELNTGSTEAPVYLSADGLLMLLSSNRDGNFDLYASTRASTSQAWGAPIALPALNSPDSEYDAYFSEDRLTVYFSSDTGGNLDLYMATRSALGEMFGARTAVAELNSPQNDEDVWVSSDQRTLLFTSDRGGTRDLFVSTR